MKKETKDTENKGSKLPQCEHLWMVSVWTQYEIPRKEEEGYLADAFICSKCLEEKER